MKKMKIAAVSYLNTKPFLFGLENHPVREKIEILREIPIECFRKFQRNEVDIGLVPIGGLHQLDEYHVVSKYCIACTGKVQTVCLFSDVPIEKIQTVLLDFHSVTSVLLTKALVKNYWKMSTHFKHTKAEFESGIKGETAGLIIGDRAIEAKNRFKYCYDLGETWHEWTGRPMVFAIWVSNCIHESMFESEFNDALNFGLKNLDLVIKNNMAFNSNGFDVANYLRNSIEFNYDTQKQEACQFFLEITREFVECTLEEANV